MKYDDLVPGDILFDMSKEDYPIWLMVRKEGGCATWLDLHGDQLVEDDPLGPHNVHSDYTVMRRGR